MEERKITEAESIEIITSMISRTKARLVKGSGNILLMWGYHRGSDGTYMGAPCDNKKSGCKLAMVPYLGNRRYCHSNNG